VFLISLRFGGRSIIVKIMRMLRICRKLKEGNLRNTSKRSLLASGLFVFLFISIPQIQAAYIITSLDYQISPTSTVAKIGDNVLFQMAVLDYTSTYSNVTTVGSPSSTTIVVASVNFPIPGPEVTPLYVYDGVRTWRITAA
jgi:hypothetical protein